MIAVEGLVKRHGSRETLRGVSLSLSPGEVGAVIGPSGGGKTTLLRCINGLDRLDGGSVTIGGERLTAATDPRRDAALLGRIRRRVGFIFQQFNLFPHLTVLENCTLGPIRVLGEPRAEADHRARALLDRVGLADRAPAYPRMLSGGQQQRVAIVRALAMRPEALLLDEPTSALDPQMAAEVMAVIADLARSGQTMLLVTHAVALARQVATRVHVLAGGVEVERGPPEALFGAPRHEVTRALLRTEPP